MITIVDYGMGNLGSIHNMFRKIGIDTSVTADVDAVATATKLVLPGVGAFDAAMENLKTRGLVDVLTHRVLVQRVPVLGICLGMQIMTEGSEEGARAGLGWIKGRAHRFNESAPRVPHMGWNIVRPLKPSALTEGMATDTRFYFVHSFRIQCADRSDALLEADYGGRFDAAFERANVMGVQFHPEKSHHFGMALLRRFGELPPC
jgi:imidazole glycerol-phosphate synthase subunit HisH